MDRTFAVKFYFVSSFSHIDFLLFPKNVEICGSEFAMFTVHCLSSNGCTNPVSHS